MRIQLGRSASGHRQSRICGTVGRYALTDDERPLVRLDIRLERRAPIGDGCRCRDSGSSTSNSDYLLAPSSQLPEPEHPKSRRRGKKSESKSLLPTTQTPPLPSPLPASSSQAVPTLSTTSLQDLSSQISSFFQSSATQAITWGDPPKQTPSFAAPAQPFPETATVSGTKSRRDEQAIREALAALARLGLNVTENDLGKLNPPDEYEDELALMAEVRAYFDVAYKVSPVIFRCRRRSRRVRRGNFGHSIISSRTS